MIFVKAKVGTGPGKRIGIGFKRKLPIIGMHIQFKPVGEDGQVEKYGKWEGGVVDDIRSVHGELVYFVARM